MIPPLSQDPDGALLDTTDLIPENLSRLIPEVKEKDDKTSEEPQPGTGASFRFLSIKTFDLSSVKLIFVDTQAGLPYTSGKLLTDQCADFVPGNLGAEN